MSETLSYGLVNRLKGHHRAINALIFLADGTKLLSGADDQTVRYWDLDQGECIQVLRDERWGQITALNTYDCDQSMFLFVGTGRGVVSIFPLSNRTKEFIIQANTTSAVFNMNDSIEVQALDAKNGRFVVGSHLGVVKMYDILDGRLSEGPKWILNTGDIPHSLIFVGNSNQCIILHTVYTGEMLCVDAASASPEHPPNTLSTRKLQGANGSAKLTSDQRIMVVHNLNSGRFDIYNPFDTEQPNTSLTISEGNNPSGHLIKYCSFAEEESRALVCSGDEGLVHVFQVVTGVHVQTLRHSHDCSTIYAVTTISSQDRHFIASGESQDHPAICVWSKPTDQRHEVDCLARQIKEAEEAQALVRSEQAKKEQEEQDARKQEIFIQ
ncbi:WD40-repeat-containing domain protein [Armillaria nabsnona]|nr:WD40-repeat-containing domain protein [Armillaria nabsnona]